MNGRPLPPHYYQDPVVSLGVLLVAIAVVAVTAVVLWLGVWLFALCAWPRIRARRELRHLRVTGGEDYD